jgi:hypothetical protein
MRRKFQVRFCRQVAPEKGSLSLTIEAHQLEYVVEQKLTDYSVAPKSRS